MRWTGDRVFVLIGDKIYFGILGALVGIPSIIRYHV